MSKRVLFLLALLIGIEYSAFVFVVPARPSSDNRWEKDLPGGDFANVMGQGKPWQLVYGAVLMAVVYGAKTAIVFQCSDARTALMLFGLLVLFCLPVFWVFVTTDWNNAHAELAYWFNLPVGLLTVPTAGFVIDLAERPYRTVSLYAVKTVIEVVLIPVWFLLWLIAELGLGFYWI